MGWESILGSVIGVGTGIAGSIIGGKNAAKAAAKAEEELALARQKNNNYRDRYLNQDYTQTAEAQSLLNKAREQSEKYIAQAYGRSRVGGGSAEEVSAAIEQAGNTQADVASSVAAQATQQKQHVLDSFNARDAQLSNQYYNMFLQQSSDNTAAANQAMQAGMGLVGSSLQKAKNGKGMFGG